MKSIGWYRDHFLHEEYCKIAGLGDKFGEVRDLVHW